MGMEVTLRGYRPGDVEAMYRLDVLCFEPVFRFSRGAMRRFAEAEEAVTVLAEAEGELVGFGIAEVEGAAGYVVTVDVARARRGRGLGRRLMEELEARSRAAGAGTMLLHVFAGNAGAMRLYEGLGYARVGVAAGFYGTGLDGLMYEKRLG
ncbi:MAG: GNAT family N-acetyltransferase [Acidobacteriota bacterium]|nr:GNAT family N-acetyltransferase [Acidobacteriota bacterium]